MVNKKKLLLIISLIIFCLICISVYLLFFKKDKKSKDNRNKSWIQEYMKNNSYHIIDNEGGGDCLFAVIRDAFKSINIDRSVSDLRKIISTQATEETFQNFKAQYDMYSTEISTTEKKMIDLMTEIQTLKKQSGKQKEIDEKIIEYQQTQSENNNARLLFGDFKWMKGADNLSDFKEKLETCYFWAETWAINTLESYLNIKMIILSSSNYANKDLDNVLLCDTGFVNNSVLEKGSFDPDYYIITDYTGSHYKLITYDDKHIFKFDQIPEKIKDMIKETCMSKDSGIYSFISDFKKL
jgi:hypothetical protein